MDVRLKHGLQELHFLFGQYLWFLLLQLPTGVDVDGRFDGNLRQIQEYVVAGTSLLQSLHGEDPDGRDEDEGDRHAAPGGLHQRQHQCRH